MSVFVETYLFIFGLRVHSELEEQQGHHKERVAGGSQGTKKPLGGGWKPHVTRSDRHGLVISP